MSQTTYVTAYFPYKETPYFREPHDPIHILQLIQSGIHLCLFVAEDCPHLSLFHDWAKQYDRTFRIMPRRLRTCWDTELGRFFRGSGQAFRLPDNRNLEKDTVEFFLWTHARFELVEEVAQCDDVFGEKNNNNNDDDQKRTTSFAWIESSLPALFRDMQSCIPHLHSASTDLLSSPFCPSAADHGLLFLPGCSKPVALDFREQIADAVIWRFCGGFFRFVARADQIREFGQWYREECKALFRSMNGLVVWDVNFLAYLDALCRNMQPFLCKVRPVWYKADHNDSIVQIRLSADEVSKRLLPAFSSMQPLTPLLPTIPGYVPSSCSLLRMGDTVGMDALSDAYYMNTRYVSYRLSPEGNYLFEPENTTQTICNLNVFSKIVLSRVASPLRSESLPLVASPLRVEDLPHHALHMESSIVLEDSGGIPMEPAVEVGKTYVSIGLEDIRLYWNGNEDDNNHGGVGFIATNINFSPLERQNRMIYGSIDLTTMRYTDCHLIVPPDRFSWCEKNWIPLPTNNRFIYRWHPFEIGHVERREDTGEHHLWIDSSRELSHPVIQRLRGSSIFVPFFGLDGKDAKEKENPLWIGVAHFSEDHWPRHYYHVLVVLDASQGWLPVQISPIFHFDKLSVEFCTGFDFQDGMCHFIYSQMDTDPVYCSIPLSAISLYPIIHL